MDKIEKHTARSARTCFQGISPPTWQCVSQSYPLHAPTIEEPAKEVDEVEDVGSEAIDEDNVPTFF